MSGRIDYVTLVATASERALQDWAPHIVFQQVRVAPESLIVHFIGFELQRALDTERPGHRVAFEATKRSDISIFPSNSNRPECLIEVKVPWSGWTDSSSAECIVSDYQKVGRDGAAPSSIRLVLAPHLRMVEAPSWSLRKSEEEAVDEWRARVRTALTTALHRDVSPVYCGKPFFIGSRDVQVECAVSIWHVDPAHVTEEVW